MMREYDYLFKIYLIGDKGVGKTSLLLRFADDEFQFKKGYWGSAVVTIGVDFKMRTLEVNDKIVKLQIWDTAGLEAAGSSVAAPQNDYRGSAGFIVVYDITDAMSFENLSDWLSKAEMYGSESAVKVLVGTKADLVETGSGSNRAVAVEQVAGLAHSLGCEFFETSAKSNLKPSVFILGRTDC